MYNLTNEVLTFSEQYGIKPLIDAFRDYFAHYESEVRGIKGLSFETKKDLNTKEQLIHNEIEKVAKKRAGISSNFSDAVYSTHPLYRWEQFAIVNALIDAVLPSSVIRDFGQFANIRVGGFGDSFEYDLKPSDLFLTTKIGNGRKHVATQYQANGTYTLVPQARAITVGEEWYRVVSGKRSLAEYAVKVVLSLESEIAQDIYDAINDTFATLPAAFGISGYTEATFRTAIGKLKAWNNGSAINVFGTSVALSNILPNSDYLKQGLGGEYSSVGYIRNPFGVNVFELSPVADKTSTSYATITDDTRLYLIPSANSKLVQVAMEGDTMTFSDGAGVNENLVMKDTTQKRWAVGLKTSAHYGIIDTDA